MTLQLLQSNIGYMNINDRIKSLRKEAKLTQAELAQKCGVNRVAVTHWESGKNIPKGQSLLNLAAVLGYSPEFILNGNETEKSVLTNTPLQVQSNVSEYGVIHAWDSASALEEDEVEVPFYKEVELSAGNGSLVRKENTGFKLRFSKATLNRYNVDPESAACVTVSGDSMEPMLPDKATVGINTANIKVKDGKMYAVDHDGMLRVKVLHRLPGGGLRLRSFNRDEYPDEDYTADQAKEIKILGAVFWCSFMVAQ